MQNRTPFIIQFKIWNSNGNLIFGECHGGIYVIGIPELNDDRCSNVLGIYGHKDNIKEKYDYINSFII